MKRQEFEKFLKFLGMSEYKLKDLLIKGSHPCPPDKDRRICNCWCRGCWDDYLKANIIDDTGDNTARGNGHEN